jgi:ketosteroid isomerase-like protein
MGAMFGPEGFHRSAAQQRADGENHVGDVGQPSTEVRSVIGEGDTVVAEVHWTYRTGVHGSFPLDWDTDHVAIHTMRDGRIAHVRVYIDTEFQARLVAQEQELAQSDG